MLMGPWALTTAGAATVQAAPAAATFKKRRRVEVLSLVGVVMASSRGGRPVLGGQAVICCKSRGLRRGLASFVAVTRRYDAPPDAGSDPMVPRLSSPLLDRFAMPGASAKQWWRSQVLLPAAVATGNTSAAARSGVSSFQRTDPNGRSSMRRTRTGSGPR